jgi:hypothetical protein
MEGKRVGRQAERSRDLAGRHAFGTRPHQQPERIEAILLRQRGQARQSLGLFHISMDIEIIFGWQIHFHDY